MGIVVPTQLRAIMSEDCRNDGLEVGASLVLKFFVPPPPPVSHWDSRPLLSATGRRQRAVIRLQGQVILGGGRIINVAETLGL